MLYRYDRSLINNPFKKQIYNHHQKINERMDVIIK